MVTVFWVKLTFLNEDEKSIVSVRSPLERVSRKIITKTLRLSTIMHGYKLTISDKYSQASSPASMSNIHSRK